MRYYIDPVSWVEGSPKEIDQFIRSRQEGQAAAARTARAKKAANARHSASAKKPKKSSTSKPTSTTSESATPALTPRAAV